MAKEEDGRVRGTCHGSLESTPTPQQIIEQLAKDKTIETIVDNISKGSFPYTEDLVQDLYIELLSKPEDKIIQMYEKKQLNYFITTMVRNNLYSKNSRYYYNYMRWEQNRSEFTNNKEEDDK